MKPRPLTIKGVFDTEIVKKLVENGKEGKKFSSRWLLLNTNLGTQVISRLLGTSEPKVTV